MREWVGWGLGWCDLIPEERQIATAIKCTDQMRIAVLGATGVAGRAFVPKARGSRSRARDRSRGHLRRRWRRSRASGLRRGRESGDLDSAAWRPRRLGGERSHPPRGHGRGHRGLPPRRRRARWCNKASQCCTAWRTTARRRKTIRLKGYGVLESAVDMEAAGPRGAARRPAGARRAVRRPRHGTGGAVGRRGRAARLSSARRRPRLDVRWCTWTTTPMRLLAVLETWAASRRVYRQRRTVRWQELYAHYATSAGLPPPLPGGPERLRSFRVSNERLRGLGWTA